MAFLNVGTDQSLQPPFSLHTLSEHHCLCYRYATPHNGMNFPLTVFVCVATRNYFQDFIADNLEIFKIPPMVFNDNELRNTLGKTVTRLLSDIRSRLKSHVSL